MAKIPGVDKLPEQASSQPPGAKDRGRNNSKSLGNTPGVPTEKGGSAYHEILNDKMAKKLGC